MIDTAEKVHVGGISIALSKTQLLRLWGSKIINDASFCALALIFDADTINEEGFEMDAFIGSWAYLDTKSTKLLKQATVIQTIAKLEDLGYAESQRTIQLSLNIAGML